jgi:diguanylate cyclase (GGDEF)-like protein/PAS domain S-box-containing protein
MIPKSERKPRHSREDQFQQLIESIEIDGIYMLDCAGHVLTWNRGAEINKGYTREETIGKHFKLFFVPEDVQNGVPERVLSEAARTGRCAGEGWRLRKNGERFWASYVLTAMRDPDGRLLGFSKVIRDLTERKRHEDSMQALQEALQEERDRMHAAAECSLDALFICDALRDAEGNIEDFFFTYLNSNVEKLVFMPRDAIIGGRMRKLLPRLCQQGLFEKCRQVVLLGKPMIEELLVDDGDVRSAWFRLQAVKLRDGVAVTASDITERKCSEERVAHLAQHDALTGLPNRNLLEDRANQSIALAKRDGHKVGFILIDLDDFKRINDSLGHATGDRVLCTVARRLNSAMRGADTILRYGGDEFVAIVTGIRAIRELVNVIDKILEAIRPPMLDGNHKIQLTCSIGIAIYPDSAHTWEELLRRADVAMYGSKNSGKNQYRFFGHRKSALVKQADVLPFTLPASEAISQARAGSSAPKPPSKRKTHAPHSSPSVGD